MPKCNNDSSCKIPVSLEFTNATMTDDFKEQMSELFTELFSNLCTQQCCSNHRTTEEDE